MDGSGCSDLYSVMEPYISGTLISYLLPNLCAVRLWRCTLGLIICTENMIFIGLFFLNSDLHQTYFSPSLGDLAFKGYHAKFHGICEKLNICRSRLISRLSNAIMICMWLTLSNLPPPMHVAYLPPIIQFAPSFWVLGTYPLSMRYPTVFIRVLFQ